MTTRQLIVFIIAGGTIAGGVTMIYTSRKRAQAGYMEAMEEARLEDAHQRDAQQKHLDGARRAADEERQRTETDDRVRAAAEVRTKSPDGGCHCSPHDPLCSCL